MKKEVKKKQSTADEISAYLERNQTTLAVIALIIGTIFSLVLFDTKVSLSGDDCDYVIAADAFWKYLTYPGSHGALYPIVISPFVGLFGVKIILLKFLSVIFMIAAIWFFYKSFEKHVPAIILIPALALVCLNPHVLFFASYTYSEPLFMLFQSLIFFFFTKYFVQQEHAGTLREDWKKYLILVAAIVCAGFTRTIGFCVTGVLMLYFVIRGDWKRLLIFSAFFAVIIGLLYTVVPVNSSYTFGGLLAKNVYNPEAGQEDFAGLCKRVAENSNVYLGGFLFKYLGFRSYSPEPLEPKPMLSVLAYIMFAVSLIAVFKKNKALLLAGLYAGVMMFVTFFLMHTIWSQDRLTMVYYPFTVMFLLGGLYYLLKIKSISHLKPVYFIALIALFLGTGFHLYKKAGQNLPVIQQNLMGNDLYGLTADWENFIKMSRWADKNLPKDAAIVSRKPSISYIYTGRNFVGIFNVPQEPIDEVKQTLAEENDKYVHLVVQVRNFIVGDMSPYMQYYFVSDNAEKLAVGDSISSAAVMYKIDRTQYNDSFLAGIKEAGLSYTTDYEGFIKRLEDNRNIKYRIISPDHLLSILKEQNVKYLLLPRIRLYTYQKSQFFINTIHHYVSFISMKYPNSFKVIHTIGKDEICELSEYIGP